MAQMSDERKKIEGAFMNEYWSLRKMIAEPEKGNDSYWETVVNSINAMGEKYKDPYCVGILMNCVFDLENRSLALESDEKVLRFLNKARKERGLKELAYK